MTTGSMFYSKRIQRLRRQARRLLLMPLAVGSVLALSVSPAAAAGMGSFSKVNLVSDEPGVAAKTDPDLVNPWGLSRNFTGPWWISDNGTGKASIYASGDKVAPAISVPSPSGGAGTPTGTVFNPLSSFVPQSFAVKEGSNSGASAFLFATEDGTIAGWNKTVDASKAIIAVDRSAASDSQGDMGAVYKGLAYGFSDFQPYIYATNFRFGTVEMFDKKFNLVKSFTDPQLSHTCPTPDHCFAPFGIQNIYGKLYVTYALQGNGKKDDQAGAGNGFVDVFNADGTLLNRLVAHGNLNSPWGLTLAPHDFGRFGHDLLVGNFGDGSINAYDPFTGHFDGSLKDTNGNKIQTDGLWALAFGNGGLAGKTNELYFTAGIDDEAHGLFGKIVAQY